MTLVCQTLLVRLPFEMDVLGGNGNIFRELQLVHDTGLMSAQPSLEEKWQQVSGFGASSSPHR